MDKSDAGARTALFIPCNSGRAYSMGGIRAIFKADGAETQSKYSVSEWWLEPNTAGPGAHAHLEDDLFYVIEGTMNLLKGDRWIEAEKGSLLVVPGGATHDFENRSTSRAGVLNFSIPGGFEKNMPQIVQWFANNGAAGGSRFGE